MFEKLKNITQGRFARNVASMLTGNIFSQAISFVAALAITRLYTPDDFGIMTYIWSLTSLFSMAAGLSYQWAIVLPPEEEKAEILFDLSLILTLCVTIIAFFAFWNLKGLVASRAGIPGVEIYLWFVPLGMFVNGIRESLDSINTRFKHFKLIATSLVMMSTANSLVKIIPALLGGSYVIWLVAGNVMGPLVAAVLLMWAYGRQSRKRTSFFKIGSIWEVAKEYINFPKYILPTELIWVISTNLPVLLFAAYFSPAAVGFYGLANNILRRPSTLIGQSLNRVFLQKAAEVDNLGGDLLWLLKRTTTVLALIGIVPFGIIMIFGGGIFVLFFGQQWHTAGVCAQILSPWLFMGFVNTAANQLILVKQALKFKLLLEIAYIVFSFVGIYVGHYFFPIDFKKSLMIFSFVGFSRGLFLNYTAFVLSKKI